MKNSGTSSLGTVSSMTSSGGGCGGVEGRGGGREGRGREGIKERGGPWFSFRLLWLCPVICFKMWKPMNRPWKISKETVTSRGTCHPWRCGFNANVVWNRGYIYLFSLL